MSLKHFHIAFIAVTVLFFSGFAAWCLLVPDLPGMFVAMGWGSIACAVGMLIYGIRFFKKMATIRQ
ncbi:MAG: hypothetical protein KBF76_04980 [Verrucomicrobiales bacterium]|jgi:hypothetical protein|nr:hypothetical protein [Verrucomicrobiales bacterium]HQZ26543.1 hypothetical protein [Verrucomicrobiales bacterium]